MADRVRAGGVDGAGALPTAAATASGCSASPTPRPLLVGFVPGASSTASRGRRARRRRLAGSRLLWEAPDVVVVNASPGAEEFVLAGIADVVGADVPCIGGPQPTLSA